MALTNIQFKPGFYKNGTPYSRQMRWEDGNLVRWHDGAWRPIGGWTRRQNSGGANIAALVADPALEAVRDVFSWRDLSQAQNTVFGSNLGAYHMNSIGTITDITPGVYVPSNSSKDSSVTAGYGQNPYGVGAYGAANNLTGQDAIPPNRWYFANFGELLIYGSRNNGDMFEVDPDDLATVVAVSNAPTNVRDICTTAERQIFAVGTNGEPRRVQCSDTENRTDWTPVIANQSISRVLAGNGALLRCIPILDHILVIGEEDAHAARYIGPPYIYGFDQVGDKCGIICPEAATKTDRFVVWWGDRNFWLYDGTIQQLPCEVIDFLYKDIDPNEVGKIVSYTNTTFSEIWWHYQSLSTTTTEVDSYVAWNYVGNFWYTGRLNRTAAIDKGVLRFPVMVNADGEIYNHELADSFPTDEGDVYVQSGPIRLGKGDRNIGVRFIFPDTENTGDVTFTLIAKQFPNATEYTYGPYAYNNPVPTTGAQGRSVKLRADFQQVSSELGVPQLDLAPTGTGGR